jgi:hypothetical protein
MMSLPLSLVRRLKESRARVDIRHNFPLQCYGPFLNLILTLDLGIKQRVDFCFSDKPLRL